MGWIMAPTDTHILIHGSCECSLIWQKELCRCGQIKDIDYWYGKIILYNLNEPKCHPKYPCKRGAERDLTTEEKLGDVTMDSLDRSYQWSSASPHGQKSVCRFLTNDAIWWAVPREKRHRPGLCCIAWEFYRHLIFQREGPAQKK